jgi:hypothetical protein
MLTVVVPAPADFLKVPLLLKADVPPNTLDINASLWQSQVPLLLIAAPVPARMLPVPVQVVVPAVFRIREERRSLKDAPLNEIPPFAFVVPAPVITPPVQVVRPELPIVPVPPSVPPEKTSAVGLTAPTLLTLTVPPEIVSEAPLRLPAMLTVPVLTTVGRLTLEAASRSWVPPPSCNVPDPVNVPLLVPPAVRLRVPA